MNRAGGGHRQGDNDRAMDNSQVVQRAAEALGCPEKESEKLLRKDVTPVES